MKSTETAGATFKAAARAITTKEKVVVQPPPPEPLSVVSGMFY